MAPKKIPYARAVLNLADGDKVSLPVWAREHCQPACDEALARIATEYASHDEPFAARDGQLIRQSDGKILGTWCVTSTA